MEKFSVSRMIGSPPGYVGYDEAGQLTEKIRRRPYSVVLFDEIEKAHPDVMNLLLQILDDGRITDAQGRTVNFENTVIIMTTNAGSNTRTGTLGFGLSVDDQSRERAQRALNEFLRPEFLNRIDEIVYFNHLTEENFRAIAALMLDEVRAAMAERGMTLHWTPAVIDYLVRKGYSETYGARNLRRTIQRDVEDAIASAIVARRKAAGDIGIDAQDDHITVTINDREVNRMNRLEIIQGDITKSDVDAIVNAANCSLLGGGGVDGAIHMAAGTGLLNECRGLNGCRTGEAKITRGYRLPARHVIHTPGPRWRDGQHGEPELLANCYRNCLRLASENGCHTVDFPSISTGIYHFPLDQAAQIAVREITAYLADHPEITRVRMVCFDSRTRAAYAAALAAQECAG